MTRTGDYIVHVFTSSGTFTVPTARNCSILVIGGGGAGTQGGGGGGGFSLVPNQNVVAGSHAITVGAGGTSGNNGGNSSFGSLILSYGGGGGEKSGASGGGARRDADGPGGYAIYGSQGYNGGSANAGGNCSAGGGGGSGGPGQDGVNLGGFHEDEWQPPEGKGGDGGIGRLSDITGANSYYGGGGGGTNESGNGALPSGGPGGGGAGSRSYAVGGAGTNGLGGGGGAFAPGGSGIVIVRYYEPVPPQTISFGVLPAKTLGDAPFTLSATASSGLPVSFAVTSGPATISGNTVTLTGLGTVTITASQSGDLNHAAAPSVSQSFTVKYSQTVTFGSLANRTYGDAAFSVAATASSGLPVVFAVTSGPAVVSGSTVTLTGAGSVTITATQPGNTNYYPAPGVSQSFSVGKGDTVVGAGGTITRSGDYLVHTFTANGTFAAPAQVTAELLLIGGGGSGTQGGGGGGGFRDVFGRIIPAGNHAVTVGAGGTSGNNGGNSVFNNIIAHGGGGGEKGGASGGGAGRDANGGGGLALFGDQGYRGGRSDRDAWSSAGGGGGAGGEGEGGSNAGGWDENDQSFQEPDGKGGDGGIGRQSSITGTYMHYAGGGGGTNESGHGDLPAGGLGGGGAGSRSNGMGGAGTNGLGGGGGAFAAGGSGVVIIRYYSPVPIPQSITFASLANRTCGDAPFQVSATASSGFPVTFWISSGPATISGNTVTLGASGLVTVSAGQAGGAGYGAAPTVSQTFTVNKTGQTLNFPTIANRTLGSAPFTVAPTASSGFPVAIAVSSGPAVVLGGTVTPTAAGTVTITANQPGNDYIAAVSASQSFAVLADTSPPTWTAALVATSITVSSAKISWNQATDNIGVTGYEIYRNGTIVGVVGGTSATVHGLVAQNEIVVKARDAAGNVTPASLTVNTGSSNPAADADQDLVPDNVESLLGTATSTAGTADTSDQLNLKVQNPKP